MKLVKDNIYKDISCVCEFSSLRQVIRIMKLHRIPAVPVVNQLGEYLGCISEREILSVAVPEYMKSMYNTSFMHNLDQIINHLSGILDEQAINFLEKNYPYVSPDDSMSYAADLLYRSQRTILPVVDGKILAGWISRIEILSVSLDEQNSNA